MKANPKTTPLPDDAIAETEVARMTGVTVSTLQKWRVKPPSFGGIPFSRLGRAVRYKRSTVQALIDANTFVDTTRADARKAVRS